MMPGPVNKAFEFHCSSGHRFLLILLRMEEGKVNSIILFKRQKCFKNREGVMERK